MLQLWKTTAGQHSILSPLKPSFPSSSFLLSTLSPLKKPTFQRKPLIVLLNNHANLSTVAAAAAATDTTISTVTSKASSNETFFADDAVSWSSLGVSDKLSHSLSLSGFPKPSLIQAACIPSILSGKDTIVAAETGSGKTHSYLVPLMEKLLHGPSISENEAPLRDKGYPAQMSLVLCPNVMLCEQVVRMANSMCDDNGQPILKAAAVCGSQGWPIKKPDIVVSTPVALLNNLFAANRERNRQFSFIRCVKYVVFDEADLLLCGSFQNQVIRLIDMLRFDEKSLYREMSSQSKKSGELNSDAQVLSSTENEDGDQNYISEDEEIAGADGDVMEDGILLDEEENDSEDAATEDPLKEVRVSDKRRGWKRNHYERSKQYIFVAATLPVNGKKTAGGILKKMFRSATWVSGNYLHRHNPRLEQRWIYVSIDTQVDALIDAVNYGVRHNPCGSDTTISRTMVFANTVEAVESVAKILQTAGIQCFSYHRNSSLEESANKLVEFREKGGILVCTDAAARGLDIPNISHVIQAEFAKSVVDFLHRVGRTARAGQHGLVTSLYAEENRDLVAAVREALNQEKAVEGSFSRQRLFRKKLKKKGLSKGEYASSIAGAQY